MRTNATTPEGVSWVFQFRARIDGDDNQYTWNQDGTVTDAAGEKTPYYVSECGDVTINDGGETWGEVYFAQEITEIFCQPNAVPWPSEECPERVVFANASQMCPYRGRGVLRLSEDGGRTWIASRTFNPAHYVYQCMTILPDGTLGLLWEREMQGLYFTRIPLEWIEAAK